MGAYINFCANVSDHDLKFLMIGKKKYLTDALLGFGAISASRGWSADNLNIHLTLYEFIGLKLSAQI